MLLSDILIDKLIDKPTDKVIDKPINNVTSAAAADIPLKLIRYRSLLERASKDF